MATLTPPAAVAATAVRSGTPIDGVMLTRATFDDARRPGEIDVKAFDPYRHEEHDFAPQARACRWQVGLALGTDVCHRINSAHAVPDIDHSVPGRLVCDTRAKEDRG